MTDAAGLARLAFDAALHAVEPGAALARALDDAVAPKQLHVLAAGKAAVPMMETARAWLAAAGSGPRGTLVVGGPGSCRGRDATGCVEGDHPRPGWGSIGAADRIAEFAAAAAPGDECWVLLSGGFSSLAAAPIHGVGMHDLADLFDALLASGLDIRAMNGIRKRFLRWGAGRLAAALPGVRVRVLAISDVPGNREEDIGSGPCAPDSLRLQDVRRLLDSPALRERVPADVERSLRMQERAGVETLKAGDPAFSHVTFRVVASNEDAVAGAAARARALGAVRIEHLPLHGEAASAGMELGRRLASTQPGTWIIGGGETTVTLERTSAAGGRCQELALAAARELAGIAHVALLAAGTDGRDGTTDAAGAVVDGETWEAIRGRGSDPAAALATHGAHSALDGAGGLIRTGPTGTNVMDIVVAVRAASGV